MSEKINHSGTVILLMLLALLIELIASGIFPEIFDPFYLWIQSIVSYKVLLSLLLITILISLYAYKTSQQKIIPKNIPEKICPSCSKPKLKVIRSTIRSFEYKCSSCGFEHRTLKEGQTNTINNTQK